MRKSKMQHLEVIPANPAAIVPAPAASLDAQLTRLVDQRVAEILAKQENLLFEPFMRSRQVAYEIRRLQTVFEQNRWGIYFQRHGCLICERKNVIHVGLGMCNTCYGRTTSRLKSLERQFSRGYGEPHVAERIEEIIGGARTAERLLARIAKKGVRR